MIKGGKGGANTNASGLPFEMKTDLKKLLEASGYEVKKEQVLLNGKIIGELASQNRIYAFLDNKDTIVPPPRVGRLRPDEALYISESDTLFIVEKKNQTVGGSTDEKIQTAVYKMYYYNMLLEGTGIKLKFMYLLNNWFRDEKYELVIDWLDKNGVAVYFEEIPLSEFELQA
jgi:hypothetical protein